MSGYCRIAPGTSFHGPYHDREYGFPVKDDAALFERLALEMNQAGLSWLTILKKRAGFREAFRGFDPARVARFGARDRARLLADAGIIRNRAKIDAVIENARRVLALRESQRLLPWMARRAPSPVPERMGRALQEHVPVHGGRDHRRLPDEHRLPARSARAADVPCTRGSSSATRPGRAPRRGADRTSRISRALSKRKTAVRGRA
jgi:DNA-3-methyladenine glycosylase I